MEYHIPYEIDYFQEEIDIVKEAGFNPTKVTQLFTYTTFVFKTEEEAQKAFKDLEESKKLCCLWYDEKQFLDQVKEYEDTLGTKVKVFDLTKIDNNGI